MSYWSSLPLARGQGRHRRKGGLRRKLPATLVTFGLVAMSLAFGAGSALGVYQPGMPPAADVGMPTFGGSATPVPAEPAAFNPGSSFLQAIFDADVAAGGTSYWFDRILARPYAPTSVDAAANALMTRGRGLYMYSHAPGTIGFAGGYAYRERPTGSNQSLYTITVKNSSGTTLTMTENTAQRIQYPSYYSGAFANAAAGLNVAETKFITDNNVAVTNLTLTNNGATAATYTLTASGTGVTTPSVDGTELTGTVSARYALTTLYPRLSGDGFTVSGTTLVRNVILAPGDSATVKVQEGVITNEIPESAADYARYRAYDPTTAWKTQMYEYNLWWVKNVPYVDVPDANVKKISYYRTWENRFNMFDGNIPGNDYQFPVDLEGALGYNNQISLTVPMRLQDLQWWRDPEYSYGPILSQGEESGCASFHDNPGNTGNWNNSYEQWTGEQAWQDYQIHGGPLSVVAQIAHYSECDLLGTLAKYDSNYNNLIEYAAGTMPGNDADSVAFKFYGSRPQDRTETSDWYSEAVDLVQEYTLLGNTSKANQYSVIADNIKAAIMSNLWADGPVVAPPPGPNATGPRVAGILGNAVKLSGSSEYVSLPTGIVSSLTDFTVSAWVNLGATSSYSRVFDFGTGTTRNMYLTVNYGGSGPRFGITTSGSGGEQTVRYNTQLPLNTWTHLAVTLSGTTATLYVNGIAVGTNTNVTLEPSSLGSTTRNYIGKSQYSDPYLNGTVDDFQIYSRALSASEIATLAAPTAGAGDVVSYKFDEDSGATAVDSSGNGRDGTIYGASSITNSCDGNVFLQRDLTTGNLVCWKDQQNFAPFIDNIPPNTDQYKQALRYYADKSQFPLFPVYTANQADQQQAVLYGTAGTNNFSNINFTLQARLFSNALRNYPSQYITPDMYNEMIEWQAWNEYSSGNNNYPDNNEYFYNWNPTTQTLGRSSIQHDVLGSWNWINFQDIAGLQPRLDQTIELWPIDMGYDHFAVNNVSYHGANLSVIWQRPGGTTYYSQAPAGYSLYVNGKRVLTVDDLAHLTWNSKTGAVSILDGSATNVVFNDSAALVSATGVDLTDNARIVDSFQKAGLDLNQPSWVTNLAAGKTATASFTTTSPAANATSPANAVDGDTISGIPYTGDYATVPGYTATAKIWGTRGSPNAQDWLQVDLGSPTRINDVKLYFYSNKAWGSQGNTYREPSAYSVQYFNGTSWADVPGQTLSPNTPAPNYNEDTFPSITTQLVRVLVTPQTVGTNKYGVGIKEIQIFDTDPAPIVSNDAPAAGADVQYSDALSPTVTISAIDHNSAGSALSASATGLPAGLSLADGTTSDGSTLPGTRTWTVAGNTTAAPGSYPVVVTVTDETGNSIKTYFTINVRAEDAAATYTGDQLIFTAPGGNTADVVLRATIQDSSLLGTGDTAPGDIRNANVTFMEGTTVLCGPAAVQLLGTDTTSGTFSCTTSLGIGAHTINVVVGNYYVGTTDGLVEVASPDGSFITGGGNFTAATSAGTYAATKGTKEQFAANVKYNKKNTNIQGHANVIFVSGGHTYQIASNALDSLGTALQTSDGTVCAGPPSATCIGTASFRAKATLTDITDPLNPVLIAGNLSLSVSMTDKGEPGSSDSFGVTLYNGNTLLFSSQWDGAKTIETTLLGGNIVVH